MHKVLNILGAVILAMDIVMLSCLVKTPNALQFHALDVGQGDALLLITPDQHHILIDGGVGNAVLLELSETLPYAFREIDLMILTHPHADHMEGLISVLKGFKVQSILMSAPDYNSQVYDAFLEEASEIPIWIAQSDQDFKLGGLKLDVLYPFEAHLGGHMENINNASPVIRAEYGDYRILLTGDAEEEVESELLAAKVDLRADVLKAGHHGSRTSSSFEFLNTVSPEWMVISAGVDNPFGHPHPETLEKADDLNIEVLSTDQNGRISILFGDQDWRWIFAPNWRNFSSSFSYPRSM